MNSKQKPSRRNGRGEVLVLATVSLIVLLFFMAGMAWSLTSHAAESGGQQESAGRPEKKTRTVYPDRTELDFEGAQIQGEVRNPGEFYFKRRPDEKFDSLVKRRKNFHREMLRDAVLSK